jgi:hypothetical protein
VPALVVALVGNDGEEQGGGVSDGFLHVDEVMLLKLNADLVALRDCPIYEQPFTLRTSLALEKLRDFRRQDWSPM